MTPDPLDLWPQEIQVAPLMPLRILQLQAERLREKTQGRLLGDIQTATKGAPVHVPAEWGPTFVHRFEIVAGALNGYRHQLMVCIHQKEFAYPVLVVSGRSSEDEDGDLASSQEEFLQITKGILSSKRTIALMESLLARIAEPAIAPVPA